MSKDTPKDLPEELFDADLLHQQLIDMLEDRPSYGECLRIRADGKFDLNNRMDERPQYILVDTPEQLFTVAQQMESFEPRLLFTFRHDPAGQWMEYTVSRAL